MEDAWHTYSSQLGEHRAVITYNHSYAGIAKDDPKSNALQVCAVLKHPDPNGMPTSAELKVLYSIEDAINDALATFGAVHVGNLTCDRRRIFTFYTDIPEHEATHIIQDLSKESSYELRLVYEHDPSKERYWNDLYPTPDNWRLILDTQVLNVLHENGDRPETPREVFHWAYFAKQEKADAFSHWVRENDYKLIAVDSSPDSAKIGVHFSHVGTMALEDISGRTIVLRRKAVDFDGEYDGWETSVEGEGGTLGIFGRIARFFSGR